MNAQPIRKTRRVLGLAVALATAFSLVGVAEAHHTTCDEAGQNYPINGGNEDFCPEFSPGFTGNIRYPYRDTPAAFQVEMSQARHESLPLLTEVYYPRGWAFTTNIRPSSEANCQDAIGPTVTTGILRNRPIEGVSTAVGMEVYEGDSGYRYLGRAPDTRTTNLSTSQANAQRTQTNAMVGFLNWDADYTAPGVKGRITLCLAMSERPHGSSPAASTDVVETMYLDALTDDPDYGWRLSIDTARILDPANGYVFGPAGISYFDIDFNDITSGTWNRVNGVPTKVVWSRAPRNPVQTSWKAVATTCRSGINGYSLAACPAGHRYQVTHTKPFNVSHPPVIPAQPFSNISKAGGITIPGTGDAHGGTAASPQPVGNPQPVSGFGYSDGNELKGGTTIPVTWNAPSATSGAEVTGFAMAVAEITSDYDPVNQDAEIAAGRLKYMRFDKAAVCTGNACAVDVDLSLLTPENSTIDGKYNIGLVTIYKLGSHEGYRSDLLCDGVSSGADLSDTGRGVLCPPDRPAWLLGNPQNKKGADRYQVVVREQAWPTRYRIDNPLSLLLMDTVSGNAEYYIWGVTQSTGTPPRRNNRMRDVGPGERYTSASNLVVNPTSPTTAAFVWGKMNLDQDWSYSWQIVGEIGAPGRPFYAQFHEWWSGWADLDWVDVPGINPADPTNPNLCIDRQCGSSEGPPHMIITELSGSSF